MRPLLRPRPLSRRWRDRLKALALAAVFGGGPVLAVTADVARHHGEQAQHQGSHMERPGECLEHAHACDLGLAHSGPRLATTVGRTFDHTLTRIIRPTTSVDQSSVTSAGLRLPATRAPPLS